MVVGLRSATVCRWVRKSRTAPSRARPTRPTTVLGGRVRVAQGSTVPFRRIPFIPVSRTVPASGRHLRYTCGMGHLLGYGRVSAAEQNAELQTDELTMAGCWRLAVPDVTVFRRSRIRPPA